MITQEEFLIQHLTEDKNYPEISKKYKVDRKKLTEWWNTGTELRKIIKKSNTLFSSKKDIPEFSFFKDKGKRGFFEWYRNQERICAYCEIKEFKLRELFDKDTGILKTKRGRGRSLELERRDSESNLYNEENCILACYLCNNHKSDLITEEDHRRFFIENIRKYLDFKYSQLNEKNGK